jgi:hypothetical protein
VLTLAAEEQKDKPAGIETKGVVLDSGADVGVGDGDELPQPMSARLAIAAETKPAANLRLFMV